MKYTINEKTKLIEVETTGTETVFDFMSLKFFTLEEFEDFTIQFKATCETYTSLYNGLVTDSGYTYEYTRECDCGKNGAICSCELKNKK